MTLFAPPIPPAIDLTVAGNHIERAVVRIVETNLLPNWRVAIDLIVGTNASVATRPEAAAYLVAENLTTDGSSLFPSSTTAGPPAWLTAIHEKSGLSYTEIARLIGVERRSVYFWLEGRSITAEHRDHISEMHGLVQRVDTGSPTRVADALSAAYPAVDPAAKPDRLGTARIREGDPRARLPLFGVAALLSTGIDDERPSGDVTDEG